MASSRRGSGSPTCPSEHVLTTPRSPPKVAGASIYQSMAATVHIHLLQGQTFRHTFLLQRPEIPTIEIPEPAPVALETIGCTARMQIRSKYGEPVLQELTSTAGIAVDPAVEGRVSIVITAEQTDTLGTTEDPAKPRTKFQYDLELVYPSGDVLRVMESDACTIKRNITRAEV